jgi:tetratricopeptide (TPR) repeat protein
MARRWADWVLPIPSVSPGPTRRAAPTLIIALLLGACAGVGIVESDDPYKKLSEARYLWRVSGRVMQARHQLDEAIAIFERRDDKAGLAEAYRQYGLIARIGGANPDPVIQINPGPNGPALNPSHEELALSDGYLSRTVALATEAKRFDLVTNANFLLGNNQVLRGNPQSACPFYERAVTASREAARQEPGLTVELPRGVQSIEEGLARAKREAGCPP